MDQPTPKRWLGRCKGRPHTQKITKEFENYIRICPARCRNLEAPNLFCCGSWPKKTCCMDTQMESLWVFSVYGGVGVRIISKHPHIKSHQKVTLQSRLPSLQWRSCFVFVDSWSGFWSGSVLQMVSVEASLVLLWKGQIPQVVTKCTTKHGKLRFSASKKWILESTKISICCWNRWTTSSTRRIAMG